METIKIEKNIPIEKHYTIEYPFEDMEIGDSFFAPKLKDKKLSIYQSQILSRARYWLKKNKKNWKFQSAQMDSGIRIWRIV